MPAWTGAAAAASANWLLTQIFDQIGHHQLHLGAHADFIEQCGPPPSPLLKAILLLREESPVGGLFRVNAWLTRSAHMCGGRASTTP